MRRHDSTTSSTCTHIRQVLTDARAAGMRLVRVGEAEIEHRWYTLADAPTSLNAAFARTD